MSKIKRQKGIALIVTLVFLSILGMLLLTTMNFIRWNLNSSNIMHKAIKVQAAHDAAIQQLRLRLTSLPAGEDTELALNDSFNDVAYQLTAKAVTADTWQATSTISREGDTKSIRIVELVRGDAANSDSPQWIIRSYSESEK